MQMEEKTSDYPPVRSVSVADDMELPDPDASLQGEALTHLRPCAHPMHRLAHLHAAPDRVEEMMKI